MKRIAIKCLPYLNLVFGVGLLGADAIGVFHQNRLLALGGLQTGFFFLAIISTCALLLLAAKPPKRPALDALPKAKRILALRVGILGILLAFAALCSGVFYGTPANTAGAFFFTSNHGTVSVPVPEMLAKQVAFARLLVVPGLAFIAASVYWEKVDVNL